MKKICFLLMLAGCLPAITMGQRSLNPEVAQMQQNAQGYLNQRDYANAIMLYNQAIRQAPDNVSLRRDLAYAYYLSGDINKAKEIIDPVVASDFADEQTYQVAAAIENVLGNFGKAKRILNRGLEKYPHSGLLFNSRGNIYSTGKSDKSALQAWVDGIKADPAYAMNYYSAAKAFHAAHNEVWALVYGEIYVNLEQHSARGPEIKKLLIDAYRALFSPGKNDQLPAFRNDASAGSGNKNFEEIFRNIMLDNAAAIRNGLNTETLTMLRTRFIMEWNRSYAARYPFTLFAYQNKLLQAGYYDAYNQWLFGAADNSQAFGLWIKNNAENFSGFEKWRKNNPLHPALYDPRP